MASQQPTSNQQLLQHNKESLSQLIAQLGKVERRFNSLVATRLEFRQVLLDKDHVDVILEEMDRQFRLGGFAGALTDENARAEMTALNIRILNLMAVRDEINTEYRELEARLRESQESLDDIHQEGNAVREEIYIMIVSWMAYMETVHRRDFRVEDLSELIMDATTALGG